MVERTRNPHEIIIMPCSSIKMIIMAMKCTNWPVFWQHYLNAAYHIHDTYYIRKAYQIA